MPRPTTEYDVKGVTSHNSMLALDGSKKLFCTGCGGPRDVKLAETVPCFCCKSLGTQKTQPVFDEFGEPLTGDALAQVRAAEAVKRAKKVAPVEQAAPAPKPAAPKAAKPVSKPAPKAAPVKPATKGARKEVAARSLAAMFG